MSKKTLTAAEKRALRHWYYVLKHNVQAVSPSPSPARKTLAKTCPALTDLIDFCPAGDSPDENRKIFRAIRRGEY